MQQCVACGSTASVRSSIAGIVIAGLTYVAVLMVVNHMNALKMDDVEIATLDASGGKDTKAARSKPFRVNSGDELTIFNVLRKHFELLAIIGAFQSLPPGMTRGVDALLGTAGTVFSIGYGSADSIQCFLADLGASDRSADLLSGIPATRSVAFLTVAIWLGLVATLALWAFAVQIAIRVTSWQCLRSCLGNVTFDAILDTAPVKALIGMFSGKPAADLVRPSDVIGSANQLEAKHMPGQLHRDPINAGTVSLSSDRMHTQGDIMGRRASMPARAIRSTADRFDAKNPFLASKLREQGKPVVDGTYSSSGG